MSALHRWTVVPVLTACLALAPACGLLKRKPVKRENTVLKEMREGIRPIGTVTMLNENCQYVLVNSPMGAAIPEKEQLVTKASGSGERTGKIIVSPERNRKSTLVADVAEGAPRRGDLVYFPSDKKPITTTVVTEAQVAAGAPAEIPAEASPTPTAPVSLRQEDLPPLGQPSGPLEDLPELPDHPGGR